jgi:arylsulfatase A-like enzyme
MAAEAGGTPNVVIIYTDDQGYGDVGCFGATGWATPNLDRLAQEGRRFTSFYVTQPVCSASRTGLLTGCYSNRIGIHGALGPTATHGIHSDETTLAEICKQKEYATATFGKWHLGDEEAFLPPNHGFDEYLGIPYSNDMWPLHPEYVNLPPDAAGRKRGFPPLPLIEGTSVVIPEVQPDDQATFTTRFTERAVAFIEHNAAENRPFFLYVPHPQPHVPLFVSNKYADKSEQGLYGDVMMEIDWSVGQIVGAIDRSGLRENTLIIFATDNGPWLSYGEHAGTTGPLREGKGTTFEGGVRVPCIMRWSGRIPAGTECDVPLMTIDILPTVARLIGAEFPPRKIDGRDAWDVVSGKPGAESPHEAYFFYYHSGDLEAMRMGKWKLHFPHAYRTLAGREGGNRGSPVAYEHPRIDLSLFDLENDIGETTNVAAGYPEVVARMQELADGMRRELGDQLTGVAGNGLREPGRVE